MGDRDGLNRIVSPHMRLFPHYNFEIPSYSMLSTIGYSIANILLKFQIASFYGLGLMMFLSFGGEGGLN